MTFLYETTFKITVNQQNDKLFTFKRATACFDGDNAKAYGTVPTATVLAALLMQDWLRSLPYIRRVLYQRINRILLHSLKKQLQSGKW